MSRLFILIITFFYISAAAIQLKYSKVRGIDGQFKKDVMQCLNEAELKIQDLGINSIDDLKQEDLAWLHYLPANKRGCFMACWFKIMDIIDEHGMIDTDNLPDPLPGKTFPISFEESVNECKAKKTYCDVGACLYEIYYT